ncbi:hypothetical protein NQ176_g4694 [Zarea fungicola]|uniref:Uncharacterized protein n=1 Tax=Zarea fungicola TaxID=93591 RepID=A0ACC1NC26_9HYPO|nr:hypothetical protein NQ176_g4694 [Lecanicillium fungicola]
MSTVKQLQTSSFADETTHGAPAAAVAQLEPLQDTSIVQMSNAQRGGSQGDSVWELAGIDKDAFYAAALYLSKTTEALPVKRSDRIPKTPESTCEFLDRLADCFARAKDQTARDHVSATAMVRDDEAKKITLYIAKNQSESGAAIPAGQEDLSSNATENENEKYAAELVSWFTELANGKGGTHTGMFKTMCLFSVRRLEYYIKQIKKLNHTWIASKIRHDRDKARDGWKVARALIEKCQRYPHGKNDLESCARLAGDIRNNEKFRALAIVSETSKRTSGPACLASGVVWISFLGRLWDAYEGFTKFCSHEDQRGFAFNFILLPSEEEEWLSDRYQERMTMSWPEAVKADNGRLQKFLEAKQKRASGTTMARVHCEMQLMNYFAQRPDEKCLDYIGCSKLSCWLCWHMMLHNGRFSVENSHLKLYELWALPSCVNPADPSIVNGLIDCYNTMLNYIPANMDGNRNSLRFRGHQSGTRLMRRTHW